MKPKHQIASIGFLFLSLTWLSLAANSSPTQGTQEATPEQATFFETRIRPLLANNCLSCHGASVQMAGLRLDTFAGLQKGGASGAVMVPGNAEKSLLIQAVRQSGDLKMPPQGKKLKPAEIADLENWIEMGAPWPKGRASAPQGKALWSLQPVKKPSIPKVKNVAWAKNPIDAFILNQLEAKKLSPSPAADARTLLRRVTYDLTGLPPTAAEMDAFLADKSPTAYEKVVDRLLKSPRYGERWARHWLDVARYADTKGYVFEEDRNYYNAYTYRDWVIEAFNKDLPYDQFVIQQLAADRLPEVQDGDSRRPLAALGFLTVGRRFLNNVPDIIDDRIDVTMRGFQGFTVSCARCHDHKFDPIPTQDYYSLYAVFASSQEASIPISDRSIRDPWEQHNQRIGTVEKSIQDLVVAQVGQLRQKVKDANQEKLLSAEVKQTLQMLRVEQFPNADQLSKLSKAFDSAEKERLARLQANLAELRNSAPPLPEFAMAVGDSKTPGDGYVFKRGNPHSRGEAAPRRFLAALTKPGTEREHWTSGSGRLELARAITAKDNPLTARVFVNRVWHHHFGAGIVRTPSDFGHQGDRPTHPELLDYLATYFMENGWSIKKLHKLMVTSAAYRQSSSVSKQVFNADPDNRYWARMNRRRLDMEQMRDSLMLASGRLDLSKVGGKSVQLWTQPFAPRRGVYGFIERQNLPGTFRTFDFASPDSTSPRRFYTTVPQQALFLMNSPFSVEQARGLADRADIKGAKDNPQRVRRLYRQLFARLPDAEELAAGVNYLKLGSQDTVESPSNEWRYGYGALDAEQKRLTSFTPFTVFSEGNYRGGQAFPDAKLGYLLLNAFGGHPGRDASLAVVRRWIAPANLTVKIGGVLKHDQAQGDGVRARVISSRSGVAGEWRAKSSSARTEVASIQIQKGDTLDFVVDCIGNEGFDAFAWAPTIQSVEGGKLWDANSGFGPPPPPGLTRLALYAQALMMTNEFMFVD